MRVSTKVKVSVKHLQINKANNLIFIVVAAAVVITVFSLISAKALVSQSSYQRKVLDERNKSIKLLKDNVEAANILKEQYEVFAKGNPNILGGQGGASPSNGPIDGDNARIVLDALPSQYDFPALLSSVEKIAVNANLNLKNIDGTDAGNEVASESETTNVAPESVQIPFSVGVESSYSGTLTLINDFERSIRPIDIIGLTLSGNINTMNLSIQATAPYQSSVSLQVNQKEVNK